MDDEPEHLSNRLLVYDPNTNKWTELGPMKYSKYRCSAVVLNGEIFVIGKIARLINSHYLSYLLCRMFLDLKSLIM